MLTEIKTTRNVARIMGLIEEYRSCPDEVSLLKTACEVYQISHEDAEIADSMKSFWIERADGADG